MTLEDLEVYQIADQLSDIAWDIYTGFSKTLQYGIGNQFLDATDSIGANIAEGFGRYHYKDSMKFYYNARGSLFECKHWIRQIDKRKIAEEELVAQYKELLELEAIKLNSFIKTLRSKLN